MATVAVLVPWRPNGCPNRLAAWEWCRPRYPWPTFVGTCPTPEWRKALAVADALSRTTADIIVVADADVACEGLQDAVDAVEAGAAWAVPHGKVHRLDESSTAAVYAGGRLTGTTLDRPYWGHPGGGLVVMPTDVYRDCPLDPRFAGWGGEDDSFALALRTFHGEPWRGTDPLWHLWHPPQPRQSRRHGSAESMALYKRYRLAAGDKARVRRLIEEVSVHGLST